MKYKFGQYTSNIHLQTDFPALGSISRASKAKKILLVCDANTKDFALTIKGKVPAGICVLETGEEAKNWASVEKILQSAAEEGLDRDGLFVGIGGGVVSDLTAFAASIYKRGASLALVSTTLLGMADAALGGKTGFDLFGIKNFAGTFYPASHIFMPLAALDTLPCREKKSGLAEIIKCAILDKSIYQQDIYDRFILLKDFVNTSGGMEKSSLKLMLPLIKSAVQIKGRIVKTDPLEKGKERALLNLGHTFAHALETAAGLGTISHGEAVAWGIVRAAELSCALNRITIEKHEKICSLIKELGYETKAPHPAMKGESASFIQAIKNDKKIKNDELRFIIPVDSGAKMINLEKPQFKLVEKIAGIP
jgi:3-dehydroquinate synthase